MNDYKYIENLINRYFSAETTVAEERELRNVLATTRLSSRLIDEARAVIGYSSAASNSIKSKRSERSFHWLSVAASVALILVAGSALLIPRRASAEPRCIAYVNSVAITDPDTVQQLAFETLTMAFGADAETQQAQINELNSAVIIEKEINNQIFPI